MTTDSPSLGKKVLRIIAAQVVIVLGGVPIIIAATEKNSPLPVRAGLLAIGLVLMAAGICYRYGLGKKETTISTPFLPDISKEHFLAQMLAVLGGGLAVTAADHADYSSLTRFSLAGGGFVLLLTAFWFHSGKSKIQAREAGAALAIPGLGLIALVLNHPGNSPAAKIIMLVAGGLLWLAGTIWAFLRGNTPWTTVFFFILLPTMILLADYFRSGSATIVAIPVVLGLAVWTRGRTRANMAALAARLGFPYEESGSMGTSWKMSVKGRSQGREVEYANPLFKTGNKRSRYFSVAVNYKMRTVFSLSLESLTAETNLAESEISNKDQPIERVKISDLDDLFLIRSSDTELAKALLTPKLREQVRVLTMQENPFVLIFRHGQVLLALQGAYASTTMLAFLEDSAPLLGDLAERAESLAPDRSFLRI